MICKNPHFSRVEIQHGRKKIEPGAGEMHLL